MLISVIIPVYNGAEFIGEALASVRGQAYTPLEIIVVDDGSTDNTAQVVQALGVDIRYVYQQNQGPAAARNHGLALAHGELIAFLDADDLWPADKLTHQVADLSATEALQVVWGFTQILPHPQTADSTPVPTPRLTPCLGSLLCRKAVFQMVGGFDATLRFGEDLDWFKRLQESAIPVKRSSELALIYRTRPGSMTYGRSSPELGLFQLVRRSLERQRGLQPIKIQGQGE